MSASPHGLSFESTPDCLIVRATGRDLLEKMPATFQAIADEVRAQSARSMLVDLRQVPGLVAFMDRFQLGKFTAQHFGSIPIAVLMLNEQMDEQQIGRLVAVNRGANVELFVDAEPAIAWLKIRHEMPPDRNTIKP